MNSQHRIKHNNNTHSSSKDSSTVSITGMAVSLYVFAILGIYPWFVDVQQHYFNITITKYKFYLISSLIFAGMVVFAVAIEYMIARFGGREYRPIYREKLASYKKPEFWMGAFLIAQLFAWIVATDRSAAFTGERGRYMGLGIYMVFAVVFFILANVNGLKPVMLLIFSAASIYSYIIAIFQHMGNDFMGYKNKISPKQYDIFISTFGNINMFASFLAMSVPVFVCTFVFVDKVAYRIISGISIMLGGMCLMIANSDSGYLGAMVACIVIFFMAYYRDYTDSFILAMLCLALGNLGVVLLNRFVVKDYDKRGGVAQAMDKTGLAVLFVAVLLVIYVLVRLFGGKLKLNKRHVIYALLAAGILCVVAFVIYGVHAGLSLFKFNYKWGTYRGYIWTKCVELFKMAPVTNKLFGYGNETLKSLMVSNFNSEMVSVTGKTYDNAHNELLQYLVTTGIAGVVTYVGLFVSSLVYILKRAGENPLAYICLAAMVGYFFQGLINLNQPITTPLFFVFMALGVGSVRVADNKY